MYLIFACGHLAVALSYQSAQLYEYGIHKRNRALKDDPDFAVPAPLLENSAEVMDVTRPGVDAGHCGRVLASGENRV